MALDTSRIRKPAKKLRKLLKKMPSDPTPEQVHSLRTNARKIEAMLEATHTRNRERLLHDLSRVGKCAGRVRDMDVLSADLMTVKVGPQEKDCAVQLIEHLGAKRRKHASRLRSTANRHLHRMRKNLKQTSKEFSNVRSGPKDARADASSAALKRVSELSDAAQLTKSNLHEYRKKVKELRNLLRLSASDSEEEFVSRLGEVKDAIGDWHDWQELVVIGTKVLKHENCRLVKRLQLTADSRFDDALRITLRLREKYLGKRSGNAGHGRKSEPSGEVLSATAALAA